MKSLTLVETPVAIDVFDLSLSVDTSFIPRRNHTSSNTSNTTTANSNNNNVVDIFKNVSLSLPPGSITCILGGSGSGKTSLLNVLSSRIKRSSRNKIKGKIAFNGLPISRRTLKQQAYVQQNDFLLPYLTVRETLMTTAELRLPKTMSFNDKKAIVEEIILELGLKECANTIVGDNLRRGCSGGEKRRLSVGVQLLTNPNVLFLDEVTTGLDAFTALQLVKTLREQSRKGRTIICSIHQPRSDILELFDQVVLLSKGRLVYAGKNKDTILPYFSSIGFACPVECNPADFLIDISTIDVRNEIVEAESRQRVATLIEHWEKKQIELLEVDENNNNINNNGEKSETSKALEQSQLSASMSSSHPKHEPTCSFLTTFVSKTWVLTKRFAINLWRDRIGLWGNLFEALLMGVIVGLIFYQMDGSLSGVRSRIGAGYAVIGLQPYLLLILNIYRLCDELRVYDRELKDNMYGALSYMSAHFFSHCIPYSISYFAYSTIAYFLMGFRLDVYRFFIYSLGNLLHFWCGIAFSWVCAGISREFAISSLIANSLASFLTLTCGFFIQIDTLPPYVSWFRFVSWYYYAYRLVVSNELSDQVFDCPFPLSDPRCKPYEGNYNLQTLGIERNDILVPLVVLTGIWVTLGGLTYLLLRFWKQGDQSMSSRGSSNNNNGGKKESDKLKSKQSQQKVEPENGASVVNMLDNSNQQRNTQVDVVLDGLSLELHPGGCRPSPAIRILKNVTATFETGKLNVIFGSSGAGKSSLLNVLAGRGSYGTDPSLLVSRYVLGGGFYLRDHATGARVRATPELIRQHVAYVTQDDNRLLPSLTVRETLHYAALLRLPSDMSKSDKLARAEEVILELGLKDCANTLVGGASVKGISGGEKRRVSIGCHLLTSPSILLLDEPTSGLDAATSNNVMNLLKDLSRGKRNGKSCTVICTLHQPRSDIYPLMDYVLLLAKGGKTVYSDTRENMLSYFGQCGFVCPKLTNPADFVLDLSVVDTRNHDAEMASREQVDKLVERFEAKDKSGKIDGSTSTAITSNNNGSKLLELQPIRRSFWKTFFVLLGRSYRNIFRQPTLVLARLFQVWSFAGILALHFAPINDDFSLESIQTRFGVINECLVLLFVGMLNNLAVFPQERDNFYGEYEEGIAKPEQFFLVYLLNELPFEVLSAFVFVLIVVVAGGLQTSVETFFVYYYGSLVLTNIGESIGLILLSFFDHVGIAVSFTNLILSLFIIMSGILSIDSMVVVLQAINYISPTKYAAQLYVVEEFTGLNFTCKPEQVVPYPDGSLGCPIPNGEAALKLYGFDDVDKVTAFACVGALGVGYRLLAYVVMKIKLLRK